MKSLILAFLLFIGVGTTSPVNNLDELASKGSFSCTIGNRPFKLRDDQLFRGLVISKTGSMDGKTPAINVVSCTFNGPTYDLPDGRMFSESVWVEVAYQGIATGDPEIFSLAAQFESTNYYMVKENSRMTITGLQWESDRKHFLLSASFDCQMRSWGYPTDGKPDTRLKGSMTNVRITVPSWLLTKN